jgi:hypothetical protein
MKLKGMRDRASMLFKDAVCAVLRVPAVDRLYVFLAFQRKRVIRRRVEDRLRRLGLYGDVVQDGPFKGMTYPDPSVWVSCRFEKVIGFYEFEMYPWIERLLVSPGRFTSIVNIGAADGYFAVGLGRLFAELPVFAFEASDERLRSLSKLAECNGLSGRLVTGGWCTPADLNSLAVGSNPVVICDVDGYEDVLMDPEVVPWLRASTILLEVHEFLAPDLDERERSEFERKHPFLVREMGKKIRARFQGTHEIEECLVSATPVDRYPVFQNLGMAEIFALAESERCCIHPWYLMTPKSALRSQN